MALLRNFLHWYGSFWLFRGFDRLGSVVGMGGVGKIVFVEEII